MQKTIKIQHISYVNNIGQRPQLEDCIYPFPGAASATDKLFMVCDGVGGENMGEEASRIACEGFAWYIRQNPPVKDRLSKEYIRAAQSFALQKMYSFAEKHPEAGKMSTTLTLAYLGENTISVAWCGDSRIYHLRGGKVIWRSTDHSLVANLVKHGEISEEEAGQHPQRNVITRSLSASGIPSEIDVHYIDDLYDGDYIMLCTDGVFEQINKEILKGILVNENEDKAPLFLSYSEHKTRDNFSLYLLKLNAGRQGAVKKTNKFIVALLILLIVFAVLAGLFRKNIKDWMASGKNGAISDTRRRPEKKASKGPASYPASNPKGRADIKPEDSTENQDDTINNRTVPSKKTVKTPARTINVQLDVSRGKDGLTVKIKKVPPVKAAIQKKDSSSKVISKPVD